MNSIVFIICLSVLAVLAISLVLFVLNLFFDLLCDLADKIGVLPVLAGVITLCVIGLYLTAQ